MDTKSLLNNGSTSDFEDLGHVGANELSSYTKSRVRRRYIFLACLSLAGLAFTGLVVFLFWTPYSWGISAPVSSPPHEPVQLVPEVVEDKVPEPPSAPHPLDPLASLNGPPTMQFRDNLKPDSKYVTSWPAAGWTNDVMTYANLIYLGFITDHIPVIPMFTPSHINIGATNVPSIYFGDVFDVPRMRNLTGKPILEWREVKDPGSQSIDDIGCWNVWASVQYNEDFPRRSPVPEQLKLGKWHTRDLLDISYTKTPHWVKLYQDFIHDAHATFWSLARLAFPQGRQASLVPPLASPIHGVTLPPDEQMLCYDYLYYVCAQQPYEYDTDYSPAWNEVAQYMHWVPSLEKLADVYVNRALELPEDGPTPLYIGIHVRHYDFAGWCGDVPLEDCFASIPIIARRVREIREQILQEKGINVEHVVMTSDERNETWWQEVADQGWKRPDHSQTKELYGHWYPVLIDAAIQSRGIGFVGTDRSTMSIMAKRRVESWSNGTTVLVKWGHVGADDH